MVYELISAMPELKLLPLNDQHAVMLAACRRLPILWEPFEYLGSRESKTSRS